MSPISVRHTHRRLDRTRARAWALQVHYRWDVGWDAGDERRTLPDALDEVMSTRRIAPARVPYLRRLVTELHDHGSEVDELLSAALDNWRLERLSSLDRGVLRIAAIEITHFDDIPPKVSIQEAIRLAERYGGIDSPAFVNGVLDALYKQVMD